MTLSETDNQAGLPEVSSGRPALKVARDLRMLSDFVSIFCRERHKGDVLSRVHFKDEGLEAVLGEKDLILCAECTRLLLHATTKLLHCPQDPKPMCKKCTIHCYAPGYRERIREVMKFSGMYLIRHGRLDLLAHYLA